jgi:hypothetical protein
VLARRKDPNVEVNAEKEQQIVQIEGLKNQARDLW